MSFPISCKDGYWYIWYETFEDGKSVGRGRYLHWGYKHKSSAVRRAKQMYSEEFYSPITDSIISHKWIVSQTNPWEEEHER